MSFDQSAWAKRIRAQMDYEWQREGPPEGFPALPPIPTGRYAHPASSEASRKEKTAHMPATAAISPVSA